MSQPTTAAAQIAPAAATTAKPTLAPAAAPAVAPAARAEAPSNLAWTRLASLLAIFPLGIWTVIHIWNNLQAFGGAEEWQRSVTGYSSPISHAVTLVIVLLPLALHAIWGAQRTLGFLPNNTRYGYYNNLKYAVQRLTAVGALGFLGAHIWLAMLNPRINEGHPEAFAELAREMHHHLPTLAVYLVGTLAIAYHLANGLFGFSWSWGLISGRASFRRMDRFAIFFFLLLTAGCWGAIYALYQAGA